MSKFRQVKWALQQDKSDSVCDNRKYSARWVRWKSGSEGWIILNTDGAAKGNPGPTGAGGVLRGDKGEWLVGFLENLGHCSSIKAEFKAVWRGLNLANEMQAQRVWLQIDSKIVVSMLTRQTQWHPEHRVILQKCSSLLEWVGWEVRVTHCFREANQVADFLAKMDSDGTVGVTIHRSLPMGVWEALYADSSGVYWPRLCKS